MDILNLWLGTGKDVENLIDRPSLQIASPSYGLNSHHVECIIVVDKDIYVDLLVKNNIHTRHSAIIISENMYPSYMKTPLKNLLLTSPQTLIYFVHDATPDGMLSMEIFKKNVGINIHSTNCRDLGFSLEDFKKHSYLTSFKDDLNDQFAPLDLLPFSVIKHHLSDYIDNRKTPYMMKQQVTASVSQTKAQPDPRVIVDLQEEYWKVQLTLSELNKSYDELNVIAEEKTANHNHSAIPYDDLSELMARFKKLKENYVSHRKVVTSLTAKFQALDKNLFIDKAAEMQDLEYRINELQDNYFLKLDVLQQPGLFENLQKIQETLSIEEFWLLYEQKSKEVIEVRETLEKLEMQYLPYQEKTDEKAEELWRIFDREMKDVREDKVRKAKTRDFIIAYGQQITTLVKDKEACDQLEAGYKASINKLTTLTQAIQELHHNHHIDKVMDKKNEDLWLNYASFGEEDFWVRYRELLYIVKNPMIGVASPLMQPGQKQKWEQLYHILGM